MEGEHKQLIYKPLTNVPIKALESPVGCKFGYDFKSGKDDKIIEDMKKRRLDEGYTMQEDDEYLTFINPTDTLIHSYSKETGRCISYSRMWLENHLKDLKKIRDKLKR